MVMGSEDSETKRPRRIDPEILELAERVFFDPIKETATEKHRELRAAAPKVKGAFDEIFSTELEGWCYGLANFPGEIFPAIVHRAVTELSTLFQNAVRNNFVFDLGESARKLSKAAKYLVPEKEIAFSILAHLPHPRECDEDGQYVIAMIIDQAETKYGGALERLERKWSKETRHRNKQAA